MRDSLVDDLVDLSTFTEDRGFTTIGEPKCPACEIMLGKQSLSDSGAGLCPHCNTRFWWRASNWRGSPLFSTFVRVEPAS